MQGIGSEPRRYKVALLTSKYERSRASRFGDVRVEGKKTFDFHHLTKISIITPFPHFNRSFICDKKFALIERIRYNQTVVVDI